MIIFFGMLIETFRKLELGIVKSAMYIMSTWAKVLHPASQGPYKYMIIIVYDYSFFFDIFIETF